LLGLGDSLSAARAVDIVSSDPAFPVGRFFRGAYAARQQNWGEVERQLGALKAGASGAAEVGDEEGRRANAGHAWALGVYAAVHRGDLDGALRRYEDYRPLAVTIVREIVAYDLGRLAFGRGEFELARDLFTGLTYSRYSLVSLSELRLAETLEALGEWDEARHHYARFLRWFEHPDANLEPLRDRAQGALARLTQEPRS
jgi:tetratricopeptide (TPR) repeat protein